MKLGAVARLTVRDYRTLNNPIMHLVPSKMFYWQVSETLSVVVEP